MERTTSHSEGRSSRWRNRRRSWDRLLQSNRRQRAASAAAREDGHEKRRLSRGSEILVQVVLVENGQAAWHQTRPRRREQFSQYQAHDPETAHATTLIRGGTWRRAPELSLIHI